MSDSLFASAALSPAGTRETAFVHAISAAGLAHALTRACSSGRMDDCGCDRSVRGVSKEGFKVSPLLPELFTYLVEKPAKRYLLCVCCLIFGIVEFVGLWGILML